MSYPKLEAELQDLPNFRKEVRLFAEIVGLGPGVRERLAAQGYRDFRYDYQIGDILVEIQGFGFSHKGRGQQRDWEKGNAAVKEGYRVLYFPAELAKTRPDIIKEYILDCAPVPRI